MIEKVETEPDSDIFRSAMADEPTEQPVPVEPKADATGRLHGQDGKYVPKEAEAAPIQQQAPEPQPAPDKDEAQVPSWRLRELREQREKAEERAREFELRSRQTEERLAALQRQWEQSQVKQEPVDFFANPDEALQQRLSPIESRFEQMASRLVLRASKAEAVATHGAALVSEMEQAIGKAVNEGHPDMQALSMQMRNSDDPVGLAMNWYKRDKLLKETGGDITNYRTKLQEDLLKDPAFLAKALDAARAQASGKPHSVQIPPSLNKAAGSAGNGPEDVGDMSDASLWAAAKPTRRK